MHKTKILGLDISSSTIGWSFIEYDKNIEILLEYGNIKPPKSTKGSLAFRALAYARELEKLLTLKDPDVVAIEAYASKFSKGKSTARTIITLSFFNEISSVICLDVLKMESVSYPVTTIRSTLSKIFKRKIVSKEDAFDVASKHFSNFKIRNNRSGNIAKECFDEADSIAVCLTHIYKERKNG